MQVSQEKKKMDKRRTLFLGVVCLLIIMGLFFLFTKKVFLKSKGAVSVRSEEVNEQAEKPLKLYWFIPDGLRADPELFNIYEWAKQGELPNIKKLMDKGAYGYSIPLFPSHTPVNFACLLTGSSPKTHGVADGPMHVQGYPLSYVSLGGFRSVARKIPAIWSNLEEKGKEVLVFSVPGSTPPELSEGITIKGRWGGWGANFYALNFQSSGEKELIDTHGRTARLFYHGPALTQYVEESEAKGWKIKRPVSFSVPLEATTSGWEKKVYLYIYDTSNDGVKNYDRIIFSEDKRSVMADLKEGVWSEWIPIDLLWMTKTDYDLYTPKKMDWEIRTSGIKVPTQLRIKVIKLDEDGFFRVRFIYNQLNKYLTQPFWVAEELIKHLGPMVDFPDSWPPQLIYFPEDKTTLLEESSMSFDWHQKAVAYILNHYQPEVVIHDTNTPNQLLTSRWWLGYLDPSSSRYKKVSEQERLKLWEEVKWMYKEIDKLIGKIIENTDENWLIVLSADHGIIPLNRWVHLNNLFAKEGLLKFTIDEHTGYPEIDWQNTKAIYLKFDSIYINPEGLGGNWKRTSGKEYEHLRQKVIQLLKHLQDENGIKPVESIVKWEDAKKVFRLPEKRVGDLVIANRAGYGWSEEITKDLKVFTTPLKAGYKQAIIPDRELGLRTPFIIAGAGIKKGYYISKPLSHIDQYPTIMKALGFDYPEFVEGTPLKDIFEAP